MHITSIKLGSKYKNKKAMMNALAQENFCADQVLSQCNSELIKTANPMVLSIIDGKVKNGQGLTFEEAFSGMLLAVSATNNSIRKILFPKMLLPEAIAKGVGFLQLMATKEAFFELLPEEIAGMVAAASLDVVFRPSLPEIVETCGMGGDRGWNDKTIKTINASTLSGVVLASMGLPTFKHGSYGNTTKVGSTDVPINFGANIYHDSTSSIFDLFVKTNFWYSDAHSVKTIHYLSHLLMTETVNHILGPMTLPISVSTKLFKVMGVNHNVNPETIARAYAILHQKGFINLGGAIIVAGLDKVPNNEEYLDPKWVKEHSFLDEISPRATLVSIVKKDQFLGSFLLTDDSFDAEPLQENALRVENAIAPLMQANETALMGRNQVLAKYLARNASLGLLAHNGLDGVESFDNLPGYYKRCLEAILSGKASQTLKGYAEASGGKLKKWS